jgi:hypothetical protein
MFLGVSSVRADKRSSKLEDVSIQTSHPEKQREKELKESSIQELGIIIIGITYE